MTALNFIGDVGVLSALSNGVTNYETVGDMRLSPAVTNGHQPVTNVFAMW